ncbi:CPBP family intramembrane glutamic endopeptidase [Pelolinea submarina]|uniref:CAAX prenyl protease 2/Lysostaphin resistance protein A-like domain-containing protein n=1 Tax=Pelolinea submarina TaxID=913107 RepID=A0A3E0A5R1_9CHLR|nr:CPBP family intramembrane glutamic endopeptidase [Pelolinea submarina]REG06105.1 hypothetical protein DFR64_2533 [Pelolinea submarina]
MDQTQIEKHTTAQSIILHLLPGVMIGLFLFLIRPTVINFGYPSIFALVLAVAFILIPAELGYLLYQGKKKSGRYSLKGIINFKSPGSWWQFLICVFIVFGVIGIIMTLMKPLEGLLKEMLFSWIPDLDPGLDGNFSRTKLTVTFSLYFLFVVVLGPLIEELYFRGYLFPRMKWKYSELFHSFLFAAYHVFSPWMIISRTAGFLPLILVVKKKSIYHGFIVHILCNLAAFFPAVVFIINMS